MNAALTQVEVSEVRASVNRKFHKYFDDIIGADKVNNILYEFHHSTPTEHDAPDVDEVIQEIIEEYDIREEDR